MGLHEFFTGLFVLGLEEIGHSSEVFIYGDGCCVFLYLFVLKELPGGRKALSDVERS